MYNTIWKAKQYKYKTHLILLKLRLKKKPTNNFLKYNLKFTSLIAPGAINNLRLMQLGSTSPKTPHNKLVVKQSYLLLTWLTYIKGSGSMNSKSKTPSFFVQPRKQSKFTHIKAPMAHKTFSQEQFIMRHYVIVISFKSLLSENSSVESINDSLFIALSLRNSIPFFNTNLLFLKRIQLSLDSKDSTFMKLY